MKILIKLFVAVILLTGFTIPQEKPQLKNEQIILPDGKLMSRIDGSITEPNYDLNTLKNNKSENDAPIGTPFSWDGGLYFNSFSVYAIAVSGSDVFIGGSFTGAMGDSNSNHIVRYNQKNNTWHPLGTGLNGNVRAIAVSGNNVYVGGDFTVAGGNVIAGHIARWDGSSWNALGVGLNDVVYTIAISGSDVYVGGDFTSAGGIVAADRIARWNGISWHDMGALNGAVYSIVVNDLEIFVGGAFTSASSSTGGDYFAVYFNSSWSGLGASSPLNGPVYAIEVSGYDLYIGGAFTDAGYDNNADAVAYFDLNTYFDWLPLGTGIVDDLQLFSVTSLALSGDDLYVGGNFTNKNTTNQSSVVYWNGIVWEDLTDNIIVFGTCSALDLSGTDLLAGGFFGFKRWFGAYAESLYAGVQKSAASGSGLVEFNTTSDSTRISLNLIETGKGNGIFNVYCYENKPAGGSILPVSNHRWIIENEGFIPTLNFLDVIRIKFSEFADSSGIINPWVVQIYHRPTPGRGQFTALYTEYDLIENELWAYINNYGEFAIGLPNTIDGLISTDEYGSHINGQNRQLSDGKTWYMRSDDYYMYFGISNYTDSSDAVNIYLDHSNISPVNFHWVYYGTQTGTGKDGLSTNLPFGADFFAYVKPAYDEYKHSNQFGGWMDSVANNFIRSYNDPGDVFEFAIPLSSLPVSTNQNNNPTTLFNWLGFLSNNGNISSRVPSNPNPSGISNDLTWYYEVYVPSPPFEKNSYTHIGPSIPDFGAIDCYEFTFYPQDPATFINRTTDEWNIEDDLWVYGGTLTFQNPDTVNVGSFFISGVRSAPATTNFSYGTSDAPLVIKYRLDDRGDSTVIFMDSGHVLTFDPAPNSSLFFLSWGEFQNIVVDNNKVLIGTDMIINESLTFLNNAVIQKYYDTVEVILKPGALLNGNGYVDGALTLYIQNPPGPNGGGSPDNLVVNFPVGTANGPSPVSVDFSSVTSGGKLTVEAYQSIQPNTFDSSNTLQRYWKITKDNDLAFTSADITFNYRPEDFNGTTFSEATDEDSMIVGKYDASWSYPSIFTRTPGGINDGGSITISGVTSFSDFTMFKSQLSANIRVFLEGPFASGSMSTSLNTGGSIPLAQPYSGVPWSYIGTESVASIPTGVVDWVLLELRSNTTTQVARRAAFLRSNGSLVDLDGTSNVSFPGVPPGNYYLVINHRNHLPIMTANPVQVSNNPTLFDLSTGQGQAFGTNAMKDLGGGVYGLYTADTDGSGTVNATDRSNTWNQRNLSGYYGTDVDLSGTVNAADRSAVWNNRNINTQVPSPVNKPVTEIVKENNQ